MAGATKICVYRDGVPTEGIKVLVGSIVGIRQTTNLRGIVAFDLTPAAWEGFVTIHMEDDSGITTLASIHLIEGQTHDVEFSPIITLP